MGKSRASKMNGYRSMVTKRFRKKFYFQKMIMQKQRAKVIIYPKKRGDVE